MLLAFEQQGMRLHERGSGACGEGAQLQHGWRCPRPPAALPQVEALLSEESMERMSVGALKKQLVELQREVNDAHDRLHLTQVGNVVLAEGPSWV